MCGLLRSLERYHNDGYLGGVCTMLQLSLKRDISRWFKCFSCKDPQVIWPNTSKSIMYFEIMFTRWLSENGAQLNIPVAIKVASTSKSVEIAHWLTEDDRVGFVCTSLYADWRERVMWILDNSIFKETSSRMAIRKAVFDASEDTIKWFIADIRNIKVCEWCFSRDETDQKFYSEQGKC